MRTLVMWSPFVFFYLLLVKHSRGTDYGSFEVNQLELTPVHDAIIFNDIADIMNELDNSMNNPFSKHLLSDSGEDIEDLLSEYQHYLNKAHKQRINYIEKSKIKNKVPLIRHEKYIKKQERSQRKYKDNYSVYFNKSKVHRFPQKLNLFMSHNVKNSGDDKPQMTNVIKPLLHDKEVLRNTNSETNTETSALNLFPTISRSIENPIISSCYCKLNETPSKCNQCIISTDSLTIRKLSKHDIFIEHFPEMSKYTKGNKVGDDKLNIRIKIDVQLPKLSELSPLHNYMPQDKTPDGEGISSKEIVSTINLPFPYLNFPIPIELLGLNKMYERDVPQLHKIAIHKKKKSRLGNNNKKHFGKKVLSFHSTNVDKPITIEQNSTGTNIRKTISQNSSMHYVNEGIEKHKQQAIKHQSTETINDHVRNHTMLNLENTNSSIESIYLKVNISKNENETDEPLKIENSIETDLIDKSNLTAADPLRLKREVIVQNVKIATLMNANITATVPPSITKSLENYTKESKKFDKSLVAESELLYWPTVNKNITLVSSKNITALILERENKKAKLNMTHDKIRSNRTKVLEQAIFGDVIWSDVDTVAPVFMSFVGKYIKGVLTFCSQNVCHSMNCAEKACLHRICTPDNRFKLRGHCTGNNDTDSVAAMESIMDLPSNIVFDIVDILQDKLLGQMYGKATLCIVSKCNTFVASKKLFQSAKCISKELNSSGHCPVTNVKNI